MTIEVRPADGFRRREEHGWTQTARRKRVLVLELPPQVLDLLGCWRHRVAQDCVLAKPESTRYTFHYGKHRGRTR